MKEEVVDRKREAYKQLWQLCFDDSETFVDLYFRERYTDERTQAIWIGRQPVAAMQLLPYHLSWEGQLVAMAYVSGACTHPDFRQQGLMQQLLAQSFAVMKEQGILLSTLIPANTSLFHYYARSGYVSLFYCIRRRFAANPSLVLESGVTVDEQHGFTDESYAYLNRKLSERICAVQHTVSDFKVVCQDMEQNGGSLFVLRRGAQLTALALAMPLFGDAGNVWRIDEVVADTPADADMLLQAICTAKGVDALEVIAPPATYEEGVPLGMGRIIDAFAALQRYASLHPELSLSLALTDEQLADNNGCYVLHRGSCSKTTERLVHIDETLTIAQLTERIFLPLLPYMSLMLN